ncbi:MAG: glycosyltransferase family 2 protein [Firmicutes bacterium]|nr:glycosyltransferase family 2 protein [Bacillota bacterium]
MSDIKFSIVLPCYNEAENLPLILERYASVMRDDVKTELILVNNGSTDNSASVMAELLKKEEYSFARSVLVEKNIGYGHGIFTGIKSAQGEFIGFSHADMQCPAEDLFKAYDLLNAQPDPKKAMVKGRRLNREIGPSIITVGMSMMASVVLTRVLTDINAQPKVFHRSHVERMKNPPNGFELDLYVTYLAKKANMNILTIPVIFGKRAHGVSKWAFSFISRYKTILAMMKYIFKLRFID